MSNLPLDMPLTEVYKTNSLNAQKAQELDAIKKQLEQHAINKQVGEVAQQTATLGYQKGIDDGIKTALAKLIEANQVRYQQEPKGLASALAHN